MVLRANEDRLDTFTFKDVASGVVAANLRAGTGLFVLDQLSEAMAGLPTVVLAALQKNPPKPTKRPAYPNYHDRTTTTESGGRARASRAPKIDTNAFAV